MTRNGMPTLLDMLVEESNPHADTIDYTASGKIRHRLLQGETIARDDPVERYGVSRSLLDQVAKTMARVGWDYEWVEVEGGGRGCRLLNPAEPIDEGLVRSYMAELAEKSKVDSARKAERREAERKAKERADRKRAREAAEAAPTHSTDVAVNGVSLASPPPPPPPPASLDHFPLDGVPSIDAELTVYLVARNVDGTMTVGLRNGTRAWVATLTGVTAVDG